MATIDTIENENRFRELIESLPETIFETDENGIITFKNLFGSSKFGYSKKDVDNGLSIFQLIAPEDRERARENFKNILGGESPGNEYTACEKNGETFPVIIFASPFVNNGKPSGLRGIIADITKQKNAEIALRESRYRYKSLFESANDSILIMKNEIFIDCNLKTLEMFGCSRSEIIGQPPYVFSPPLQPDGRNSKEKALEMIDNAIMGRPQLFEWRHCRYDKTEFDTEVSLNAIELEEGILTQAVVRDVTERKEAEESLKQGMEKLRRATGSIIEVIAMAVEARDPYTAGHQKRVSNLARSIARKMGLLQEQIDCIRMAGIIHDLGKISIPSEILSTPRMLTKMEFDLVKEHPLIGYNMLKDIEFPWPIADVVLQHHERIDGSGYPHSLKYDEILLEAKILAVSDVVEAIASHRPYRPALGIDKALEEIEEKRGILFEPEVVDICLKLFRYEGFKFE